MGSILDNQGYPEPNQALPYLTIKYEFGGRDALFPLNPAEITGDINVDRNSVYLQKLTAGTMITLDQNGYVKVCDGSTEDPLAFLILSVLAPAFENQPALASERVSGLWGGNLIETNAIADEDIVPGDVLYCSAEGLLTKTAPRTDAAIVGRARTANSTENKTVLVQAIL